MSRDGTKHDLARYTSKGTRWDTIVQMDSIVVLRVAFVVASAPAAFERVTIILQFILQFIFTNFSQPNATKKNLSSRFQRA